MDPSQQFSPTSIPESSQMLTQENSRDDSGWWRQKLPDARRSGNWAAGALTPCAPDLGCVPCHQRILTNTGLKGVRESRPFKCPCSFCVSNGWDPSENARIGNYDTKPLQP
nr:developmental pluripotency-associated protein 3 [Macaca nemestrina]